MKPGFLIILDTEGDDEWSYPRVLTTHNDADLLYPDLLGGAGADSET